MVDVGTLVMKFKADDAKLMKSFDKINKSMKNLAKIGGAALTGIATASVKTAMDFEKGMSKVEAITGSTAEQMDQLEATAKKLGATTAFSAKEAAEGMSFLGMAGYDTNQIIEAMPGLLDLAAASQTDLARTADIVSDAMTAFGLSADQTGRFADVLAKASSKANTNVEMLGESFKYVAPVAGAFGFSIEDTTAALGVMANSGIKASQAGTTLRAALLRMNDGVGEAGEVMEELGISMTDSEGNMRSLGDILGQLKKGFADLTEEQKGQAASALFGKNAMAGMLAIVNDTSGSLETLTGELENASGSAKDMADTMLDNLAGQMTILKSSTEAIAISIGQLLIPALAGFASNVQENMPVIQDIMEKLFGAIVDGATFVKDIFDATLMPVLDVVFNYVKENAPEIKKFMVGAFEKIVDAALLVWDFFDKNLLPIFKSLYEWVAENMPLIKDTFNTAFEAVEKVVMALWKVFTENILPVLEKLFGFIQDNMPVIEKIMTGALKIIKAAFEILSDAIVGSIKVMGDLIDVATNVFGSIGGIAKAGLSIVGGAVESIIGTFRNLIGWIDKAISTLRKFFKRKSEGSLSVSTGSSLDIGKTISGNRAYGGQVDAGKSYIVGEKGREIFTPSTSGYISDPKKGEEKKEVKISNSFNINSIVIREEADIQRIARELFNMQRQSSRGYAL